MPQPDAREHFYEELVHRITRLIEAHSAELIDHGARVAASAFNEDTAERAKLCALARHRFYHFRDPDNRCEYVNKYSRTTCGLPANDPVHGS
jgi:hypothetical protein